MTKEDDFNEMPSSVFWKNKKNINKMSAHLTKDSAKY